MADRNLAALGKGILQMQEQWDRIKPGKNATTSVFNLWCEAREMHQFLQQKRREAMDTFRAEAPKYSAEYQHKLLRQLEDDFNSAAEEIVEGFRKDVRTFVENKETKINEMLLSVPSQEQRALLETLRLRGKTVSKGELIRVLPAFYNNAHGLIILSEIAREAGHSIPLPMPKDAMELSEELEAFKGYFLQASNQLAREKPDIQWRAFLYTDPSDVAITADARVTEFVDAFDKVPQLQEEGTETLSAGEQVKVKNLFRKVEQLNMERVADQLKAVQLTEQILEDNPDDVELILRSKYAKYVRLVFDVRKARMDAIAKGKSNNSKDAAV